MKTDLFQYCGHCWVFQICWHIVCSTFTASSFRIWNSSAGIPSPPLALFVVMLSKTHLTSYSRMSGSRWVTTPSRLSWLWRSFFSSSSAYSWSFRWVLFHSDWHLHKKGQFGQRNMHNGRWCENTRRRQSSIGQRQKPGTDPVFRGLPCCPHSHFGLSACRTVKMNFCCWSHPVWLAYSITAVSANCLKWWGLAWDAGLWQ